MKNFNKSHIKKGLKYYNSYGDVVEVTTNPDYSDLVKTKSKKWNEEYFASVPDIIKLVQKGVYSLVSSSKSELYEIY